MQVHQTTNPQDITYLKLSPPNPSPTLHSSWKHNLEPILQKNIHEIEQIYGSIQQLIRVQQYLPGDIYDAQIATHASRLSTLLESKVETLQDINEIFTYFISDGTKLSKARFSAGLFSITNFILVLSIILSFISAGYVFGIFILPIFMTWPLISQLFVLYFISILILILARSRQPSIRNYVAFTACLSLAGSYFYHLDCIRTGKDVPIPYLLAPILLVWGSIGCYFKSQLIGFITVGVLQIMLGTTGWIGPLCVAIGFSDESEAHKAMVSSIIMLGVYVLNAVGVLKLPGWVQKNVDVFEKGVMFLGTFVYFLALLILSSEWIYPSNESYIAYNVLATISGLSSFYLGKLTPKLRMFRGVALTFFALYLMQKYIEINWGTYWSLGLLGGGLTMYGIALYVKSNPSYFVY